MKLYEIDYRLLECDVINTCLIDGKNKKDVVRKFWLLSPNCKIIIKDIREVD